MQQSWAPQHTLSLSNVVYSDVGCWQVQTVVGSSRRRAASV